MSPLSRRTVLCAFLILSVALAVSLPLTKGALTAPKFLGTNVSSNLQASHQLSSDLPGINWTYSVSGCVGAPPGVGDINGDGDLEIVVVSWAKIVYCLSTTGELRWQQQLSTPDPLNLAPVIADINGDGKKEVIVAYLDSCVFCLDQDGKLVWSYTVDGIVGPQPVGYEAYPPVVVDVDGDSKPEILFGSTNNNAYCLNGSGALKWRYGTGGLISASPVIVDVNHDGKLEVLAWSWDGCLYILNASGGLLSAIYSHSTHANFVVQDIDGDGDLEAISEQGYLSVSSISLTTGELEWIYSAGGGVTSPIVADVDNDQSSEIIFGSFDNTSYCLSSNGSIKWLHGADSYFDSAPVATDIDRDGQDEVVFELYGNMIWVLRGANGELKYSLALPESGYPNSPVVADINNDGYEEAILSLAAGGSGPSWIYSVQFPWGTQNDDTLRTALLILSGSVGICIALAVVLQLISRRGRTD